MNDDDTRRFRYLNHERAHPLVVDVPISFSVRSRSETTGSRITRGFPPGVWDADVLAAVLEDAEPWVAERVRRSYR